MRIGPWRGEDPRNDDWSCPKCRVSYWAGGASMQVVCTIPECGYERQFDDDEQRLLETSERSGELLFQKVVFAESASGHPKDVHRFLDSERVVRQQGSPQGRFVQLWYAGGGEDGDVDDGRRYALIAIPLPTPEQEAEEGGEKSLTRFEWYYCSGILLRASKPDFQVYTYPAPRQLDSISEEILHEKFPGVAYQPRAVTPPPNQ